MKDSVHFSRPFLHDVWGFLDLSFCAVVQILRRLDSVSVIVLSNWTRPWFAFHFPGIQREYFHLKLANNENL